MTGTAGDPVQQRVPVPFEGPGAGTGALTWGQQEIYSALVRQQDWLPMGGTKDLTPDVTVEQIVAELSYLVDRHQSLRTRLRFEADGTPRQVVSGSGATWLDVVDAGDRDPAELAAEVEQRYRSTGFDYEHDWPMRVAVIRSDGVLTHQVTILCHLAADAFGARLMVMDAAARSGAPITGLQGLELARWQRSPASRRQHRASMRHWEKGLHNLPVADRHGSAARREPRYWEGRLDSTATYLALRAIMARTGADSGHVLLALWAVAYGRHTRRHPVALRLLVHNRFRRDLADVVAPVTQPGLLVADVDGVPFLEALDRVRQAATSAIKHAYCDPTGRVELVATVAGERDPLLDTVCFFNDRRVTHREVPAGPVPTAGQIRAALPATTQHLVGGQDLPFETAYLHIEDEPETISMLFGLDTHFMSVEDMQACMRGMEAIAVEVACAAGDGDGRASGSPVQQRVPVPFEGPGAGVEGLTWAQQDLYSGMVRQQSWLPMGGTKELTPDVTVEQIVAELSYLVSRHQSLRTRLRYEADGTPLQAVSGNGATWLDVIDAGDRDPAELAAEVEQRYRTSDFDFEHDWPMWVAVIRSHGVLTHQVTILCHLAADAFGARLMVMDAFARSGAPITGLQGLELARWQRSPASRRQHRASMRHWEKGLRSLPISGPPESTARRVPRYWHGLTRSTATYLALRRILAHTPADSGHVLLALWVMAYGRQTQRHPVALKMLVNNRFRRDLADVVAPVTQSGLFVAEVDGVPFFEALDRVRRAAMLTFKHTFFDPRELAELEAAVAEERGPVLPTMCYFNDRRVTHREIAAGPVPTAAQIRAALPSTTQPLLGGQDAPFEAVFLHIQDEPDIITTMFEMDSHCMSVEDMQACMLGMEAIAVEVACALEIEPAPAEGVEPAPADSVEPAPAESVPA